MFGLNQTGKRRIVYFLIVNWYFLISMMMYIMCYWYQLFHNIPDYSKEYHDLHFWKPTLSHKIYPSLSICYLTHLVFQWLGYMQHFLLLILFWIQTVPWLKYCILWNVPVVLVCIPFLKILEKEVKSDIVSIDIKFITLFL